MLSTLFYQEKYDYLEKLLEAELLYLHYAHISQLEKL